MNEGQLSGSQKAAPATMKDKVKRRLLLIGLFLSPMWDWACWLGYELRLSRNAVFLTQRQDRHLRRASRWLWKRRHELGPTALVFALVLADLSLHWSSAAAQLVGLSLLWATAEQLLHVLLPMIAVVIPLAILAVTLARSELGPKLTDTLIVRLRLFALLALGIGLAIALALMVPQGSYQVNVPGQSESNMWVHRLGIWSMLGILAFSALLLAWLVRVRDGVISHRRFALISDFALREYSAAQRRDLNRYLELARESCEDLGLSFVPFSERATDRPGVESTRNGSVVDVNLRRFRRWASKLDGISKSSLSVVAWPGICVAKGEPLIRIDGDHELDRSVCAALRSCFRVRRERRRRRHSSHIEALELVTERACRSVDDPGSLEQWVDLLGRLAELGDLESLDPGIYHALSQLVRCVAREGTEEAQVRVAKRFHRQGRDRLHRGDYRVVQDYLSLLAWLFRSSLPVHAERGIQRSVYYMLFLGRNAVEYARSHSDKGTREGLLAVLGDIIWKSARMAEDALVAGRTSLAEELRSEVEKLVRNEAIPALYSGRRGLEDDEAIQRAGEVDDRLSALVEASGFYLGALMVRRALRGSLDPTVAAEGLRIALGWARTPAQLFASLERIEAQRLWMGPERFHEREIMSPLGETFWGDDRVPFLEVYILGSAARASSSADWPAREGRLVQQVWRSLQVLCERMRTDLSRYGALVPQLTAGVLDDFEAAHRQLVEITAEHEKDEIKRADLSERAVAGFREMAVESFRMNSMLWVCFDRVAPQKVQQLHGPPLPAGRTIEAKGPKQAFIGDEPSMFIAPGDPWALWNDAVCLEEFKESTRVEGPLEEAEQEMNALGLDPELVLVSLKARRLIARVAGFHRPTPTEREEWTGRAALMGSWLGRPVLGADRVPEEEVWLLNLSEACELFEYTEATPRVEVASDRPLEVVITFPQRLELRVLKRAGVMRVRLGAEQGGRP